MNEPDEARSVRNVVLASASPRRQELLGLLGISYDVMPSEFDETTVTRWPPETHVMECSRGKACDVASRIDSGLIVGADTIVVVDDLILGKPRGPEDARLMLELLSGRSHYVFTGVCIIERNEGSTIRSVCDYVRTQVDFAPLTDGMIRAYVATGEPLDKAGAYGIQERGCVFVEGIVGDYFNVVGLPVFRVSRMLLEFGVTLFV
jgi:septum formation protein